MTAFELGVIFDCMFKDCNDSLEDMNLMYEEAKMILEDSFRVAVERVTKINAYTIGALYDKYGEE